MNPDSIPGLYSAMAEWFHFVTAPEDYGEEAGFYSRLLTESARIPVKEILEMGSGGGNNASHMKSRFTMTLTDLSNEILEVSRKLNPECEHLPGDMRTMRLERKYDAVFVQDAVSYMATEEDLSSTLETAFVHCKPGAAALFCPDFVQETFDESTEHGGHSRGARGLRYLEWTRKPEPGQTSYIVDMAYILRQGEKVQFRSETHRLGLFSTETWLDLLKRAGFNDVKAVHYEHRSDSYYATPVFVGIRGD